MKAMTAAGLLLCFSGSAFAAAAGDAKVWLVHLEQALTQTAIAGDYQKQDVAQVAAVRGSAQDVVNPDKPVWKGGFADKENIKIRKERAELAQDVALLLGGKTKEGKTALLAFEAEHPRSLLAQDAQLAIKKADDLAPPKNSAKSKAKSTGR